MSLLFVKVSFSKILGKPNPTAIMRNIESFSRVCCKSEERVCEDSAVPFIRKLLNGGHESVIEHEKLICTGVKPE